MDDLKPLLVTLLEALKTSANFTMEQAPLVLQEMLWWGAGMAVFWWAFWWLIALILYVVVPRVLLRKLEDDAAGVFTPWFRLGAVAVAIAGAAANSYTLLHIWLAPRLYLVKTIGSILRGQ